MLSTDSPPFNPRNIGSGRSPIPGRSRNNSPFRSRSSSPFPNPENVQSNAIPKYEFDHNGEKLEIRNVWAENVEEEMYHIRELIEKYPYVAMDTEFPGVVARPVSETFTTDYHYKSLKCNVDLLKIIQLGLSFADAEGNFAPQCPCWQFNFKFSLQDDMFAQDSIDLLVNSGISFEDHATRGIDPLLFGELLMVSGLVLDDRVKWVSFHSGYDYGYLLKLLTTKDLPADEKNFFENLRIYFPTIYDIKYMTSLVDGHFGGLQKLADDLGCQRLGAEHQAGSDSLLTMSTYFALAKKKFTVSSNGISRISDHKYKNELFGYGSNHTVRKSAHLQTMNSVASE
uniref:poly(A)-specific ribonuclease n=1 Tax=Grammatophora oceanica TaxID=210454 RepID=A0A7S1YCK0_9STRA|mmetsp:Transcript_42049/g.62240  ORF Transcript_42049/g.62240 Transcript_42049/m.62240 type:complete len:341 (+) Transcript_42049:107-1129(+)